MVVLFIVVLACAILTVSKGKHNSAKNASYTLEDSSTVIKKKNNDFENSQMVSRNIATENDASRDEPLAPLTNAFVIENRKHNRTHNQIFGSLRNERREALSLQVVGGGKWSQFPDLQVSDHSVSNLLFSMGPYHISRKEHNELKSAMSIVFDENQQTVGVLTGRLVVKVKDLYDVDLIARDYQLKLENVSTNIRTAYMNAADPEQYKRINEPLSKDSRIERFYFEIVKTDWVKN